MSDSVRPHRRQPTRLLCPWDSPGKNAGVGCHFLLQCMKVESESQVAQSCPTPSDPMDCSLPGSSVHGIFQAPSTPSILLISFLILAIYSLSNLSPIRDDNDSLNTSIPLLIMNKPINIPKYPGIYWQ